MADDKVTLYEEPSYGGKIATIDSDAPDLTERLKKGASSIKFGANSKEWRVFTKINYQGDNVTLDAGRTYPNLAAMGISSPVMSMRKTV